ncbi:MAG: hypothetical protein IJP31_07830 [Lachnospiraceae bacterium]|nr:hypothetical protein [Lachnospiraceae bacterium]
MRGVKKGLLVLVFCLILTGCGAQDRDGENAESRMQTDVQTEQAESATDAKEAGEKNGGAAAKEAGEKNGGAAAKEAGEKTGGADVEEAGEKKGGTDAGEAEKKSGTPIGTLQPMENAFVYSNADNQLCFWQQGSEVPVVLTEEWLSITFANTLFGYSDTELESIMETLDLDSTRKVVYAGDGAGIYFPSRLLFYPLGKNEMKLVFQLDFLGTDGSKSTVASDVFAFQGDQKGNLWYSVMEKTAKGEKAILYRYDGEEHQLIGSLGSFEEAGWQVSEDGSMAVFLGEDEGLYAWSMEAGLWQEPLTREDQEEFYLAAGGERVISRKEEQVQIITLQKGQKLQTEILREEWEQVYILGEDAEYLFFRNQQTPLYEELLFNDISGNAASDEAWELIRKEGPQRDIFKCQVGMYDTGKGAYLARESGFYLESLEYEQMEPISGCFFLELIPEKNYKKQPLSIWLAPDTPEDFLEDYEVLGQDMFDGGLNDLEPFYALAQGYVAGKGFWKACPGMEFSDQAEVRKNYDRSSGDYYVRIIRYLTTESGEFILAGEDTYVIDQTGKCKKVVEAAGQARFIGDQLYYTRIVGQEDRQKLFTLEGDGALIEADSINLDSMKKSLHTGCLYYLTGSYGIYDSRSGTLSVYDGKEEKVLEEQIASFRLYGEGSVAALQYVHRLMGEETYRLIVIEDGESKIIEEDLVDIFTLS